MDNTYQGPRVQGLQGYGCYCLFEKYSQPGLPRREDMVQRVPHIAIAPIVIQQCSYVSSTRSPQTISPVKQTPATQCQFSVLWPAREFPSS